MDVIEKNVYMEKDTYKIVNKYFTDLAYLQDRIMRTVNKRGNSTYISKINAPDIDECYVVNACGNKDYVAFIDKVDGCYCFATNFYQVDGTVTDKVNVFTKHFVEQYRNRNNMYATPIKDVLYDIVLNVVHSNTAHTDKFDRAVSMNNDCVAPIKCYSHKIGFNRCVMVDVFLTCLNVQDTKVKKLHNNADQTLERVNNIFGEAAY